MIDQAYLERLNERLAELEADLSNPATVADQNRFRAKVAEHLNLRHMRGRADTYLKLVREREEATQLRDEPGADPELREMAKADLIRISAEFPDAERELKIALLPPDPDDSRNTIMEIRAGTGGDEAGLFAGDLFRMYQRFADKRGWAVGVIDASPSELGGFKEIVFSVEGEHVYRTLRYESGGHRVQRVPVTEASGRIHTSAATVAVLPEATEVDEIQIRPDEVRIDLFRASGAGGQKVNKTESAVRMTHLPTGIVVQCQDERSQQRNRDKAMKVLCTRLLDLKRQQDSASMAAERKSQVGSGDRSERIRTYNFPQNRMTDHRINLTLYSLDRVMEGEMEGLMTALYERDIDARLKLHLKL